MKKNRMKQALDRELDGVRVSGNLKERILAEAAVSRTPSRKRSFSMRPLAIAAAVMVVCGLTAGMIMLRQEKPDLSATTLSAAKMKAAQDIVWVRLPDGLYHAKNDCEKVQDPISMQLDTARAAGLKGCSNCIEDGSAIAEDLVWMTSFGSYYHSVKDCSGMTDAVGVLEIEAKMLGGLACAECFDGSGEQEAPTLEPETLTEQPEATWFPVTPQPTPVPVATVEPEQHVQWAQATPYPITTAEPTPTPVATLEPEQWVSPTPAVFDAAESESEVFAEEMSVWMTNGGVYYHVDEHCSGMENALQIVESEALEKGKQVCPVCMAVEQDSDISESIAEEPEEIYVWATANGVFYHLKENCSGMSGADYITKDEAIESGKMRCEVCMKNTVWVLDENVYYHIARYCSGMMDAVSISEKEALDVNKQPCPSCIGGMVDGAEEAETVPGGVWVNDLDGIYYHSDAYCASSIFTAAEARQQGKAACAVCAENVEDDEYVWMDGDKHFHLDKYCTERSEYTTCSEEEAAATGRTRCVLCMRAVWMTDGGMYYHSEEHCSGMMNAHSCSITDAQSGTKQPCPVCMPEEAHHAETEVSYQTQSENVHHEEKESSHHAESEEHH